MTTTPDPTPDSAATEKAKVDREAALSKAYTLATTDLRTAHQKEFNDLRKKHAKALGYDWEPSKSPEDKAADQVAELLEKFPGLADRLAGLTGVAPDPDADDEPVGGSPTGPSATV